MPLEESVLWNRIDPLFDLQLAGFHDFVLVFVILALGAWHGQMPGQLAPERALGTCAATAA